MMASKILTYRINKLEELVKERSSVIDRLYAVESDNAVLHEQLKEMVSKLSNLEKKVH